MSHSNNNSQVGYKSQMHQVKKHILMRMAQESDFVAAGRGAPSWAEFLRMEPDAEEPDWHPFFTESVEKLNNKKLDYLMGRTVSQTFRDDGRPKTQDIGPGIGLRNQAVYLQTQRHQAAMLEKNRQRILRQQERMNPRDAAGGPAKGAFRGPRPQMGPRDRGYLPN
mgnify:CR=1 FL=1